MSMDRPVQDCRVELSSTISFWKVKTLEFSIILDEFPIFSIVVLWDMKSFLAFQEMI